MLLRSLARPQLAPPARLLHPRVSSLARGNVLVFGSVVAAILLSHAPRIQPTLWLLLPALSCLWGMAETIRCVQPRWSFYHAGVLFCLYMDLMAITLVLFLLIYPFFSF